MWSIIDCATKESDIGNNKLVWILIILFGGVIGSAVYILVRRPKRKAEVGR
jgi:heme/copper-type cytochrome/quinol oxidase subunit 2